MARRCGWAGTDPLYIAYHDEEWGVPQHGDGELFELLVLEGAQAGLSWLTILRKRAGYREAFDQFDAAANAKYDDARVARLLSNQGIVRNRLKIAATIQNAKSFLAVQKEFGNFDSYIWSFVGGAPRENAWETLGQVPSRSPESEAMSRYLIKRGFRFVGPTICYAFMQAAGLVNDHLVDCFRYGEVSRATHTLSHPH